MAETYLLYEYNKEGYHNGALQISEDTLEMVFETIVRIAKNEGREVVITDVEDFCVFHTKNGVVLYPTPEMYAASKS